MSLKPRHDETPDSQVIAEKRIEVKKPRMYAVILLNDDYTPMDFVVWLLETVFHKPAGVAARLMMDVHLKGKGVCGVFTCDVARTKAYLVKELARKHEHPLECILEAAGE